MDQFQVINPSIGMCVLGNVVPPHGCLDGRPARVFLYIIILYIYAYNV